MLRVIASTKCFIFDCDGVIWKGDSLIEGIPDTLALLRKLGKQIFFVTNNSTKSRKGYVKKFHSLGLEDVAPEEVYSSSYAAAAFLKSTGFPEDKKVYVVGEIGIQEELELAGIRYCGGTDDVGKTIDLTPGLFIDHDADVGAVVVGFDRHINYHKIQYATLCIRENQGYLPAKPGLAGLEGKKHSFTEGGCIFIGTNPDAVTHLTDAQEWAGNGSMVGAIKGSTKVEPMIVGKPNGFMLDNIASTLGIEKEDITMVGDRLDTDILFGANNGTRTLLVLSGVTGEKELLSDENAICPDDYTSKLSDFLAVADRL